MTIDGHCPVVSHGSRRGSDGGLATDYTDEHGFLGDRWEFEPQPFKLDFLWAGLCLLGAVYFMFRS